MVKLMKEADERNEVMAKCTKIVVRSNEGSGVAEQSDEQTISLL